MKLVGMMPVRNEAWVLRASLKVALEWCDEVVIFKHACEDRTFEILCEIGREQPERLWYPALSYLPDNASIYQNNREWREMEHRQSMLSTARSRGATHLAIIDADEILTANLWRPMRELAETLPAGVMLELPGYNLRGSLSQFHSNGIWGNRWFQTCFLDQPQLHWAGDRFHHRAPMGATWRAFRPIQQMGGGTLHLWGASERRLVAKHALYKMVERLRWPHKDSETINQQYNLAIHVPAERWQFSRVPAGWLPDDIAHLIDVDAEPWQEAECRRLVLEHGKDAFRGLDLFGVA